MRRITAFAAALLCLATLTGLATAAGVPARIKTILVVGPHNPAEFTIYDGDYAPDRSSPLPSDGGNPVKLGDELNAAVVKALGERGYTIASPTDRSPDAVLNLRLRRISYVREGVGFMSGAFVPIIMIETVLTDPVSGEELRSKAYSYDRNSASIERFYLKAKDDIASRPALVLEAYRAGIATIAANIGADFRKRK